VENLLTLRPIISIYNWGGLFEEFLVQNTGIQDLLGQSIEKLNILHIHLNMETYPAHASDTLDIIL